MDELPSMNELFEIFEDDPVWEKLGNSYIIITGIMADCIKELSRKAAGQQDQIKKDIDDYKYYTIRYIIKSLRIYRSMVLLALYNYYYEATMLTRSLLENIAETKYFLKCNRAKAIRRIKLYEIINEKRRYDSTYAKDFAKIDENGHIITSKFIFESGETLLMKIENGLLNYNNEEINKMENKILKNCSWHGLHRNQLFGHKDVNMEKYIEPYEMACKLLHVREENPLNMMDDNDIYSKYIIFEYSLMLLYHIKDFITLCNFTLSDEMLIKLDTFYKELKELFFEEIDKWDPSLTKLIKLIPFE